jgi:hypothetical protein
MDAASARRSARFIGVGSGAIGAALVLAPERANALVGLHSNAAMRVIGVADVVLAPGLVRGEPRWRYVAGRAALNLAIATFMVRSRSAADDPRRPVAVAVALASVTVGDARVASVLARAAS